MVNYRLRIAEICQRVKPYIESEKCKSPWVAPINILSWVVDSDNNTTLHTAFLQKKEDDVDILLYHLLETSYFVNMKNKHGLSYMHIASARGSARIVQGFLNVGANAREVTDKDCPFYPNYTPLLFACDSKSLETVKILISASNLIGKHLKVDGSNPNETFQSMIQKNIMQSHKLRNSVPNTLLLLHLASVKNNPCVIECVLSRTVVDVNIPAHHDATYCPLYTPLHFAVEFNYKGNVECLLKNGADVERRNGFCMTPLHLAMYRSNIGILEVLYEAVKDKKSNFMDAHGLTYLHIAAAMNDITTVMELLRISFEEEEEDEEEGPVDINQAVLPNPHNFSNYTPLHFAIRYSHQKMAKLLHICGAHLNTNEGITPLQLACEIGHTSLIQYLIKHSAEPRVIDPVTRKTTLHLLVQNFMESNKFSSDFSALNELNKCMKLLVKHKVDVNAKDSSGNTVLHLACKDIYRSEFCAEELLDLGADINIKSDDGRTPLDIAWENSFNGDCIYESLALLYHHVQKLKDLGLEIDANNEEFCQKLLERRTNWSKNADWSSYQDIFDDEILEAKHKKTLEEIEKMKKVKIDVDVTLYDFLKFDMECARDYIHSKALKKIVKDSGFRVKYPSYAYLISNKRKKILKQI